MYLEKYTKNNFNSINLFHLAYIRIISHYLFLPTER